MKSINMTSARMEDGELLVLLQNEKISVEINAFKMITDAVQAVHDGLNMQGLESLPKIEELTEGLKNLTESIARYVEDSGNE